MSPRPSSRRTVRRLPWQQFTILAMVRFAEPIANTSVFPYLPAMIASFGVKPADIGFWTGTAAAIFSMAQCLTAIHWGRLSDRMGRKPVILIGLTNTMIASIIWGLSTSLPMALAARALSGAVNGNVGIIRTMVAELCPWKELQPLAFSIMPLVYSIGSVVGPTIGGAFANPLQRPAHDKSDGPLLWRYPFALPNIINAAFFLIGITIGIFFLRETLETKRDQRDCGIVIGQKMQAGFNRLSARIKSWIWGRPMYHALPASPGHLKSQSAKDLETQLKRQSIAHEPPPPYSSVLTRQTVLYLIAYTVLAMHNAGYDQIVSVILHHPRMGSAKPTETMFPFRFNRGFGLETGRIGFLFTINGFIGIFTQFVMFPPLARRYGSLNLLRFNLSMQPFVYFAIPYTALIENQTLAEIAFFGLWTLKTIFAIMTFPCCTILLTNSATSLRVLGTVNGIATSISAMGRAIGPTVIGAAFTWGAKNNFLLAPFALLAFIGFMGLPPLWFAVEGDGFGNDGEAESDSEDGHIADDEDEEAELASLVGSIDDRQHRTHKRTPSKALEYDEEKDGVMPLESNKARNQTRPYDTLSSAVLTDTEDEAMPSNGHARGSQYLSAENPMVAPRLGRSNGRPAAPRRRSSTPLGHGVGFRRLSSNLGVTRSGLGSGSEM